MKTSGEKTGIRGKRKAPERDPQIAGVLSLVQDLTALARSESAADLFGHAFTTLAATVPFDVGVVVMVEQNLDLYISARPGAESGMGEEFIARVRAVLQAVIPTEFAALDLIVIDERRNLVVDEKPARGAKKKGGGPAKATHDVHAVLRHENRTAGLVLICRRRKFTADEHHVIDIFAAQLSMLLDNLRARQKIRSFADMDDLTGVSNRRYFRRQLTQEMERSRVYGLALSILIIDVDDFKQINDSYGHMMGDVVLSEICGTVRDILRSPDGVSRFGGDEFAALLPHTDLAGAGVVAGRILERVNQLSIVDDSNEPIHCTVSIGIAQMEPGDATFNDLVRRADACLYDAKREGKNRYKF